MTAPTPKLDDDGAWLDALAGRPVSDEFAAAKRQADALRRALQRRSEQLDEEVPPADDALFLRIQGAVGDDRARSLQGPVDQSHPSAIGDSEPRSRSGPESSGTGRGANPVGVDLSDTETPAYLRRGARAASRGQPSTSAPAASGALSDARYRSTRRGNEPMRLPVGPHRRARPWMWGLAASIMLGTVLTMSLWMHRDAGEHEVLRGPKDTILIAIDPAARVAQLRALLEGAGATPEIRVEKTGAIVITVAGTPQVLDALSGERIYPQPADGKIVLVIEKPAAQKR